VTYLSKLGLGLTVLLAWGGGRAEAEVTLPAAQAVLCFGCLPTSSFAGSPNGVQTFDANGASVEVKASTGPMPSVSNTIEYSGTVASVFPPGSGGHSFSVMRFSLEIQGENFSFVPIFTSSLLLRSVSIQGSSDISVSAKSYPSLVITPFPIWGYGGISDTSNWLNSELQGQFQANYINYDSSKISYWDFFDSDSLMNGGHPENYTSNSEQETLRLNMIIALASNIIYSVEIWTDLGIDLTQNNPDSTDVIAVSASAYVDATFLIDPNFSDAGQYTLALSAGVGNTPAVPEPAMTPFLALLLGAGVARHALGRRRVAGS
jgi:hypothetical protein